MFEGIVGQEFDFYGVDNNEFKLNNVVFEAIEDPDDGWRSYLGSIEISNSSGIFFNTPLARVTIKLSDNIDGFELVDVEDEHVWLEIGTDHSDHWYPMFIFYYSPKVK